MRSILKNANAAIISTTVFDSKEAVFEILIDESYRAFTHLMNHHDDTKAKKHNLIKIAKLFKRRTIRILLAQVSQVLDDKFLLLISCSQGIKYENVRQEIEDILSLHIRNDITEIKSNCMIDGMDRVIAHQFLSAIIYILSSTKDRAMQEKLVTELVIYTMNGIVGLIK